jgi:hypothetical protein
VSFRFQLGGDLRAVAEGKCHGSVHSDRNLVHYRKPQGFIPLGKDEQPFLNVCDETVESFSFGETLALGGFQFVNPLCGFAVAFEIAVVALVEIRLVLGGSGVLVDCLT